MWIATKSGFLSVVKNLKATERADELLVRARVREDLLDFVNWVVDDTNGSEHLRIEETPDHDYPFRLTCSRVNVSLYLDQLVQEIEYPSFKDEIARDDPHRAWVYSTVWSTLHKLTRPHATAGGGRG